MKLKHIKIRSILGIDSLDAPVSGQFIRIEGDNGVGKSSILKAIAAAVGRGDQAELIRRGASSGEVCLVFDTGHELTAKIGEKGTKRTVKTPDGGIITASQGWIERLLNPASFNPVRFIEADDDGRLEQLLKVAKLSLRVVDVEAALGTRPAPPWLYEGSPDVSEPVKAIERLTREMYDTRTGINRSAKDKRSHVLELERTLPASSLTTPPNAAALREELDGIRNQAAAERKAIEDAAANSRNQINADAARAEREAAEEYQARLKAILSKKATDLAEVNRAERDGLTSLQARLGPRAEELREQVGKAEAEAKEHARAETTRSIITRTRAEADRLESESKELTQALERLDALRAKVLSSLPVPGLEIREGKLLYNGIPFQTLNSARQVKAAMELAAASAGELGLIQLDGFERLGRKLREQIEAWARASKAQFFVTRVVDDAPLSIASAAPEMEGAAK
jgi:DNA repair exonuclease SbcCD ATPase subunit